MRPSRRDLTAAIAAMHTEAGCPGSPSKEAAAILAYWPDPEPDLDLAGRLAILANAVDLVLTSPGIYGPCKATYDELTNALAASGLPAMDTADALAYAEVLSAELGRALQHARDADPMLPGRDRSPPCDPFSMSGRHNAGNCRVCPVTHSVIGAQQQNSRDRRERMNHQVREGTR